MSAQQEMRVRLDSLMHAHMGPINDETVPHDHHYERFGIELDRYGKVVDLFKISTFVETNTSERNHTKQFSNQKFGLPLLSLPCLWIPEDIP